MYKLIIFLLIGNNFLFLNIALNEQSIIKQALDKWEQKTCITFIEIQTPTSGVHYLRFIKGERSYSGIGKFYSYPYNGYQDVSVGNDSLSGEFNVCNYRFVSIIH